MPTEASKPHSRSTDSVHQDMNEQAADNVRHLTNLLDWRTKERDVAVKNYHDLSDLYVAEVQKRKSLEEQFQAVTAQRERIRNDLAWLVSQWRAKGPLDPAEALAAVLYQIEREALNPASRRG